MKRILVVLLCVFLAFSPIWVAACDSSDKNIIDDPTTQIIEEEFDDIDIPQDEEEIIDENQDNQDNQNSGDQGIEEQPSTPAIALSQFKVQALTTVNIRAQASAASQALGQLKVFDTLPLVSKKDNWYQVYYNGSTAFVSANASYTSLVEWKNAVQELVSGLEVQALTVVNIRQKPSTSSAILGKLNRLEHIPLIKQYDQNWYQVLFQGKEAYISANPQYTRVYDPEKVNALIENVIAEGKKVLGVPYEYGAQRLFYHNGKPNPNFTGKTFDCSSFVQYAFYKGAQIILKADSRSQSQEGILINENELERGDLIFMWSSARRNNKGIERIGHVVIYLGDNQILHTWGTGGVRIQEYSAGWRERFILARRML